MKKNVHRDSQINNFIGNLLSIGVLVSVTLVIIGMILGTFRGDLAIPSTFNITKLEGENAFVRFYRELIEFKTSAFIELGILTMLFTPIMRLIFAVVGFMNDKDWLYTILSLLVLGIIFLSFFLGFSH